MKIEVLGPGCASCFRLEAMVKEVAGELDIACEVQHVRDIAEIVKRGVRATPALLVDGRIVGAGRVPSLDELREILS